MIYRIFLKEAVSIVETGVVVDAISMDGAFERIAADPAGYALPDKDTVEVALVGPSATRTELDIIGIAEIKRVRSATFEWTKGG